MKLRSMSKQAVLAHLKRNGTRPERVDEIASKLAERPRVASDGRFTVIVSGDYVGVAKRATYGPMMDAPSKQVGLSIAASRL